MEPGLTLQRPRLVTPRARLLLPLTLLAACGTASGGTDTVASSASPCDRTALATAMNESSGSIYLPHKNLSEFLPNVRHAFRNRPDGGQAVTDSVVLGRVTEVARDRGFVESGSAPTAGRPGASVTTYGDPAADWRTVRLTIAVDEVLAGPRVEAFTVDVALMGNATTGEDDSQAECAFEDLGAVALFSKANPSGPEFLGIPRHFPDEAFGVADVDASDRLHFPFASNGSGRTSEAFVADVDTVDALRREVSKPERQVLHDG